MTIIKKVKKRLFFILLSLAALIIWGSGIYYGQYINEHYQSVSIRMKEEKVSEQALRTALKYEEIKNPENIPHISAWNHLEEQIIENKVLAVSYKARLIEVYGDIKQVYPMKLTKGNLLTPDDYEGCMIDQGAAYKLFGSIDPVGNVITYKNKQYYIRGIIKSPEPVFFIQINDIRHTYANIELVYVDKENGQELADAFVTQNNLASSYTILEGCFYAGILARFYKIPVWFLGLYMMYQILRVIWKRRTLPLQVFVLLLGLISVWMGVKWLLEFQLYIPERLIPTKWSDFSFWVERYKEFQNQIKQMAYLTPTIKDSTFINYSKKCIYYTLISLGGIWVFATHIRFILSKSSGFSLSIFSVILECGAIFILYTTGKMFSPGNGYFYMIPIFIITVDFANKGKDYIKNYTKL
ncbi:ABC transporter permease [Anaerocolumna sp.]|uniref:ABC transporter permease n=1 Tax=Anaerocolumna sp. TaxID=2041569 RepID=UPI0028A91285|nr:ABC transporter permease [Anaerocolumna sp.]